MHHYCGLWDEGMFELNQEIGLQNTNAWSESC